MKKHNIVVINVYRPPDCPAEIFIIPFEWSKDKTNIEIGNPMPNIILIGNVNFPIIDWQMEIADDGTHENEVQANAFLQFAPEQCQREKITYSISQIMTNSPDK